LWAFGGRLADEDNHVAINIEGNRRRARVCQGALPDIHSRHAFLARPNNNKAFLAGDISLTLNGVSVYYVVMTFEGRSRAQTGSRHPAREHAGRAVGKTGRAQSVHADVFLFKYTKYPKCGEGIHAFHDGARTVRGMAVGIAGLTCNSLSRLYGETKFWQNDPKLLPYRNVPALTRDNGYAGKLGSASAGAMADYIVVNNVCEAASGAVSIETAIKHAESRAKRYYR